MIDRYSLPEMAAVFSDTTRFGRYLEIELLVTEAQAKLGIVPAEDAAACRANAPIIDAGFVQAVSDREAVTNHDVAAFVDVVQESIGQPAGSWIHYGLTSSDVVDTGMALQLQRAGGLLVPAVRELAWELAQKAREYADTLCVGRTHGVHAEPTSFGLKLAGYAM